MELAADETRKGTNGVSTNGITANLFFDRGTFWVLPIIYFYLPKVPGRTFFPNLSKLITFAAAPLVLTPFVRNQTITTTDNNTTTNDSNDNNSDTTTTTTTNDNNDNNDDNDNNDKCNNNSTHN